MPRTNPTTKSSTPSRSALRRRIDEVQSRWSPNERKQRYNLGQSRQLDFISILLAPEVEPEILAVGAPGYEDCLRFAN